MNSCKRVKVSHRPRVVIVTLVIALTLTMISTLACWGKEVRLIIAAGRPDSENVAYNFEAFEEYTGIKVKLETGPYSSFFQKATTDLVTGSGIYDVIWAIGSNAVKWEPYLMDLTPMWQELSEAYRNDFLPVTPKTLMMNGKMIGIPWKFSPTVLFYRKDLFNEYGVEPPQTLAELRAIERKLTIDKSGDGTPEIYGAGWPGKAYWGSGSKFFGYAAGFFPSNKAGNPWIAADGQVTMDASWNIEALQWIGDNFLKYKIYPPEVLEMEHYDVGRMFMSGLLATSCEWPWLWQQSQDSELSDVVGKVGVVPMPIGPGGRIAAGLGVQGMAISAASKNKKEAWELIKWICSRDSLANSQRYFTVESPRISSWELSEIAPELRETIVTVGTDPDILWYPIHKEGFRMLTATANAIQKVFLGKLSPEQALKEVQKEVLESLEK